MEESSLTTAPSILDGDNYETWVVRMTVHLQAFDVWEAVEENYEVPPLGANPTVAQMKLHKERKTRKAKAKACLFAAVSPSIFIKIMKIDSAAKIWEYLKEEYKGDERIKNMQLDELLHSLEVWNKKDHETRRYQKEHFKQECRKMQAIKWKDEQQEAMQRTTEKWSFPTCPHCKKTNHSPQKCWWRPYVKCNKCATCFANKSTCESWLVDSGCTNHMTNNQDLFRELDRTAISKVRIGNSEYIPVKGKGTVAIESQTSLKLIYDVLFVSDIDQNLLSVGQLVEKEFKVYFEDRNCIIKDAEGKEVFNIKMKGKSFALNLLEDEHVVVLQQDSTTMF
ncbi:hypothetical protein AAG906_023016 [Vitis piasezkii]